MPCEYDKEELGSRVIAVTPVDECFKMTKPQRWHGLWRNNFEGSQFCDSASKCSNPSLDSNKFIWLEMKSALPGAADTPPGGLYAIDFIGRKTAYRGIYDGGARQEVVVDRVISIKEVEAPPQQPTKAEVIKESKECEEAKTCIPNWNEINGYDEAEERKGRIAAYLKDCAGKRVCMPNSEVPKK